MIKGLSEKQAKKLLKRYGPNIFWEKRKFQWLSFLKEQVFNLFNILLFGVFLISFILERGIESFLIFIFLLIAIAVSFIAEFSFYKIYEKLDRFLTKRVTVIRDGQRKIIDAEFLVPGDIIYLSKGERIPADCVVEESFSLVTDEQIFTGESEPVIKKKEDFLYAGSEVVEGEALAKVIKTSKATYFSKIGSLTEQIVKKSAYQKQLEKLTKTLTKVILIFFFLLLIFHIQVKNTPFFEILPFALVLSISIIPELFPPISVFTLSIYSKKLSRKKIIVKRLNAIEDLGIIDVLCVDKTGTITTNKLKLQKIDSPDKEKFLTFFALLGYGITQKYLSDFFEALTHKITSKIQKDINSYQVRERKLFNPNLRLSQAIVQKNKEKYLLVAGAPEFLIDYCKIKNEEKEKWLLKINKASVGGYRIYALAYKKVVKDSFIDPKNKMKDLEFLGVAIFEDSLKKSAKKAILQAKALNIDVKILTGDHPETARHIGEKIKLLGKNEKVYTEQELLALSPQEFEEVVEKNHIFARVSPEMKYKILSALLKNHHIGYLGEGINDLPALKIANVGIVVNTAQDAAKDIADIVMLEKDLATIIEGVKMGRQGFYNLIKFIRHTMADNFGNFITIGFLSLFLPFLPLTPLQILLTNFLTDFPIFGLPQDNVLQKEIEKPARYKIKELITLLLLLGAVSSLFITLTFLLFKHLSPDQVRTVIFLAATFTGIIIFYSVRTDDWFFKSRPSNLILGIIFLSYILTFLVIYTPLARFFELTPLPFNQFVFILFLNSFVFLIVNDIVKKIALSLQKC